MVISKTLSDAIEEKNVSRIRGVFYTIAHEDPSFSTNKFSETLEYVKKYDIPNLFVPYDGANFKTEDWNEEYWAEVASELLNNFCMERINHLRDVGRVVYMKKSINNNPMNQAQKKMETTSSQQMQETQPIQKNSPEIPIAAIVIVVIIVIIIILILVK